MKNLPFILLIVGFALLVLFVFTPMTKHIQYYGHSTHPPTLIGE